MGTTYIKRCLIYFVTVTYGEYPIDEEGAEITITLLGSETGSGFIMDERGIALDGDKDGKPGGDFKYTFRIIK